MEFDVVETQIKTILAMQSHLTIMHQCALLQKRKKSMPFILLEKKQIYGVAFTLVNRAPRIEEILYAMAMKDLWFK
jgi:hypothetical protein